LPSLRLEFELSLLLGSELFWLLGSRLSELGSLEPGILVSISFGAGKSRSEAILEASASLISPPPPPPLEYRPPRQPLPRQPPLWNAALDHSVASTVPISLCEYGAAASQPSRSVNRVGAIRTRAATFNNVLLLNPFLLRALQPQRIASAQALTMSQEVRRRGADAILPVSFALYPFR
jgi:hypothetical protein